MRTINVIFFTAVFHLMNIAIIVSAELQIPPSIIRGEQNITRYFSDNTGEELTLHCHAEGNPAPEYEWLFNGVLKTFTSSDGFGSFNLFQPSPSEEGTYQCWSRNTVGTAVSNMVTIKAAARAQFTESMTPKEVPATVGKSLMLPCQQERMSIPKANASDYSWEYEEPGNDNQKVSLSRYNQIDDAGNLHFASVTESDINPARVLKCHIINRVLSVTPSGSSTTIIQSSESPVPETIPYILFSTNFTTGQDSTEVIGLEGQTAVIRCFFGGSQSINIDWDRTDGIPLHGNSRFSVQKYGVQMELEKLQGSDDGHYSCTGNNGVGSTMFPIRLRVHAVPVFKKSSDGPQKRNVTVGDSVSFNCTPHAIPKADIIWYKNGIPINLDSPPQRFLFSADRSRMTLMNACKTNCSSGSSDLMVIQCSATNIHGSVIVNGYVNVLEKTVFLSRSDNIDASFPDAATFSAKARSDPDTTVQYTWQHYDPKSECEKQWCTMYNITDKILISTADDGTSSLTIYNTEMADTGTYRCMATNGISESDESIVEFELVAPVIVAYVWEYWWIPLLVILIVLILIIIVILVCCMMRNNRGDEYPVDEKEREADRDPEKELVDCGFHDYQRQTRYDYEDDRQPLTS